MKQTTSLPPQYLRFRIAGNISQETKNLILSADFLVRIESEGLGRSGGILTSSIVTLGCSLGSGAIIPA